MLINYTWLMAFQLTPGSEALAVNFKESGALISFLGPRKIHPFGSLSSFHKDCRGWEETLGDQSNSIASGYPCIASSSQTIVSKFSLVMRKTASYSHTDGPSSTVTLVFIIKQTEALSGRNKVWFLSSLHEMLSFFNKLVLIHCEIENTSLFWWPDGPANLITSGIPRFLSTTLHSGELKRKTPYSSKMPTSLECCPQSVLKTKQNKLNTEQWSWEKANNC